MQLVFKNSSNAFTKSVAVLRSLINLYRVSAICNLISLRPTALEISFGLEVTDAEFGVGDWLADIGAIRAFKNKMVDREIMVFIFFMDQFVRI